MTISVRRAKLDDLPALAPLFDAYRGFYGKPSDLPLAARFLRERLERGQSAVFLAGDEDGRAAGFVQLYPSFTSVGAAPVQILNDLFVDPKARGKGVGRALVDAAEDFARQSGAVRLSLSTGVGNAEAQALYRAQGWIRDERFCTFEKQLVFETA